MSPTAGDRKTQRFSRLPCLLRADASPGLETDSWGASIADGNGIDNALDTLVTLVQELEQAFGGLTALLDGEMPALNEEAKKLI